MFAMMKKSTPRVQLVPCTAASAMVAAEPMKAKVASIFFLFCVRSAMAPMTGRTTTWITVAMESR